MGISSEILGFSSVVKHMPCMRETWFQERGAVEKRRESLSPLRNLLLMVSTANPENYDH